MAYTQEQIDGARAWAVGKTGAEIQAAAADLKLSAADLGNVLGYTPEQVTAAGYGSSTGFNSDVANATWGGYQAPAPSPAPAPAPSYDQSTINTIYEQQRRAGEDNAGIWNAGKSTYNLSDEQLRTAEGAYNTKMQSAQQWANGKTWSEIANKASEIGLHANEVGAMFGQFGGSGQQVQNLTGYGTGGAFNAGGTPNDWKFDVVNGWTKVQPKKPGGTFTTDAGGMPTTGINLSQVQTATPWEVAKNQTVQSQLEQIIAADSPLMQQARMRALQAANQRGLLNSSMAVSAGESALYDAAMPIAQQDASTYADAGRFNADAQNTFSRDNNAFVRDAFMADFNLAANEWAKKQDQVRELDKLAYNQRLTLERDAIQNGYQSARDAILNGYTVARDEANNSFTLKRDENQNKFTASQAELDRQAAMARVAAGQTADTSMERLAAQINADKDVNALKVKQGARETITKERSLLSSRLADIEAMPGLSTAQKNDLVKEVTNSYNTIAAGHIADAGWDSSWLWKPDPTPAPVPEPVQQTTELPGTLR